MRKGKLILICAMVVAALLMVSCINRGGKDTNAISVVKGIKLSEIGDYGLEDYREFGLWSLTIDKDELTSREMITPFTLSVTGEGTETFKISGHKVDHARYICFIPEDITREAIEAGTIWSGAERATQRVTGTTLKWVILQDDETQNGTDLYEMLLTDYITLKASETSRVYNNGVLLRPKYVKSSDGNAYTLKYYYDARQVSSEHTVESAFNFLVDRPVSEQNALIFFGNTNRLSVSQSGAEVIEAPDTRERLRQVGTEGENEAYTFSQEGERVLFKIWSDNLTNAAYHNAQQYTLAIYGVATDCILLPTGVGDLYEGSITWTLNAGLARNARFTALTDFSAGNGTVNDPYQIGNWKELNNVRDYMGEDVHFMLTTDLSSQTEYYETYAATTVDNPSGWEPIGTDANRFTGHFTGYGGSATHTIADLCIDRTENSDTAIGLFGMIEAATIEQLRLENINVNGFAAVGGLVGSLVSGTITNVEVDGTVNGSINIGGFVGVQVAGSISNTNVSAEVEGDNSVGGFIGKQQGGSITYAYSTGIASGTQYAGGFVGNQYSGSIENAYTTGKASGSYTVGGFAGVINLSSSIVNAYASGNATGTGFEIGGFAGKALGFSFTITHSFWDTDVSEASSDIAIGSSTGVTGKTTAEMKSKETFDSVWDFGTVWTIVEDNSYPYLKSIPQSPAPGTE